MGNFLYTDLQVDIPADKIRWDGKNFQVWIVTESKEPPIAVLAEDNGLEIQQLKARGVRLLVETPAGVDGIILGGFANLPDPTKSISVNVWQRGGRRQTLVKPTVYLRNPIATFYQTADRVDDCQVEDDGGGCSLFGESPAK